MNQTSGSNTLTSAFSATGTMDVSRLNVVTYFLQVPAAGGTVQTPRLMRQVNGLTAVPVADNIINLQFSYDVIDSSTSYLSANLANPIASGQSPSAHSEGEHLDYGREPHVRRQEIAEHVLDHVGRSPKHEFLQFV